MEGKGFGFAHVGSSKGFKEINRYKCSDLTVVSNMDIGIKSQIGTGAHLNFSSSGQSEI